MKLLALFCLACSLGFAQIKAVCTKDSIWVVKSGSLAATALDRWHCSALNTGSTTLVLSLAGFAIDNPELEQLDIVDLTDIFNTKAGMTKKAIVVKVLEYGGAGAAAILTQNYIAITGKLGADVGLFAWGMSKAGNALASQLPNTATALSGLMIADQYLQPGQSYQWKLYTSKPPKGPASNVVAVGPRFLTAVYPPSTNTLMMPGFGSQQYMLTPVPAPAPRIQDSTPQNQLQQQPYVKPTSFGKIAYEVPVEEEIIMAGVPWLSMNDLCGLTDLSPLI